MGDNARRGYGGRLIGFTDPQLGADSTLARTVPAGAQWVHEIKHVCEFRHC